MIDNIPSDENITNPENALPESYRNLIQNNIFRELTDGDKNEEGEKKK